MTLAHDPLADPLPPALRSRIDRAAEAVIRYMNAEVAPRKAPMLTEREDKVRRLLLQDIDVDLIAERLGVDANTVYAIRSRLRDGGVLP